MFCYSLGWVRFTNQPSKPRHPVFLSCFARCFFFLSSNHQTNMASQLFPSEINQQKLSFLAVSCFVRASIRSQPTKSWCDCVCIIRVLLLSSDSGFFPIFEVGLPVVLEHVIQLNISIAFVCLCFLWVGFLSLMNKRQATTSGVPFSFL